MNQPVKNRKYRWPVLKGSRKNIFGCHQFSASPSLIPSVFQICQVGMPKQQIVGEIGQKQRAHLSSHEAQNAIVRPEKLAGQKEEQGHVKRIGLKRKGFRLSSHMAYHYGNDSYFLGYRNFLVVIGHGVPCRALV
jgi:hypothetical protein